MTADRCAAIYGQSLETTSVQSLGALSLILLIWMWSSIGRQFYEAYFGIIPMVVLLPWISMIIVWWLSLEIDPVMVLY